MKGVDHRELRVLSASARNASDRLWQAGAEKRAAWLGRAFAMLADEQSELFEVALSELPVTTGLSREMVRWALQSALSPLTEDALMLLDRAATAPNPRAVRARAGTLCVVVLAGNVFTAAARAVALPLLFGVPVLAKAAAHDASFVRLLQRALLASDAELGAAFETVCFSSDDATQMKVLLEQADIVSVYGSDNTLEAVRARLAAHVSFLGHGHGLGAAFLGAGVLGDEDSARDAASKLARDVAAYDQRGCMSPLVAWLLPDQPISPERFAQLTHEALGALAKTLPRGPLPVAVASAQVGFRGIAAMHGSVLEGEGYAVTLEHDGALRISPGYRNLQLLTVPSVAELCTKLLPFGVHLKCLGVAGLDAASNSDLLSSLPARVAPRICALGSMQEPPADAVHDGVPPWESLLRYVERG